VTLVKDMVFNMAQEWWSTDETVQPKQSVSVGVEIPQAPEKPREAPAGYRYNAAGNVEFIPGGPADPNAKKPGAADLTVDQGKALDFYQRARSSQIELERLNLSPDDLIALATQEVLPSNLANRFSDTDRRLYRAAAKNFAMATLRRESGAQIAPDEIANQISIFFPGAGADAKEIETLKRQRDLSILGLGSAAGPYGLEQANKNLQKLGFIDEQGNPIIPPAAAEAETPVAGLAAARPGERVVAEQDLKNARELQAAWQSGKSIEELNAISLRNVGSAFTPETIQALQSDTKRQLQFKPYLAPMEDVTKDMGFIEGAIETVTGSERSTPEIEAAPDWTTMPELNELSLASAGTALGTMFSSPEESVKIIQANYPGVAVRQDAKGNYILRSQDGKEYGIKPGFKWSDIPRAAGGIFAFTPAGAARTVAGAAGGAALTQAGIEATQAGAGGTFDPAEIALAGAGGAGGQLISEAIPAVVSAVRGLRRGPAGALPEAIPVPSAPEVPTGMGMPSTASEEAAIGQRLYDIQMRLREGIGSPELEQEAAALARQLRDIQTPEYMRPGYVPPRREPLPMSEPTPASTTSEEAILSQRLRDIQNELRTGPGSPQLEQEASAVSRRLRWLQTPDYMKAGAVEPPPIPQATAAPMAGVAEEVVTEAVAPSRFLPTEELDQLISTATQKGAQGKAAQQKIIELAEINPEAKAAAESLGFELPIDVYADNPQIRAALGLERSQFGTPAQGEWDVTLRKAIENADNISQQFDAFFIKGVPATGAVSQKIKTGLEQSQKALKSQASELYKKVDEGVSAKAPVDLDNLFTTLQEVVSEVGEGGLNQQEKKLLDLFQTGEAGAGDITYGRLIREKGLIRRAKEGKESPYGSLDEASLVRLENALTKDQLDNVERMAGEETRRNLRAANLLYAKQGALGKRMVSAFGRDLEGDLNSLLLGAISESKTGGARKFNKLIKTVPEEYRKEALATAIASATRSKASQGFGFAEFRDFYPALRANPEVFGKIAKEMGPDWVKAMNSLLTVSRKMTDARSVAGLRTGATTQAELRKSLAAQGKLQNFLNSTMAKRGVGFAAGSTPGVNMFVPDIIEWMSKLGKNKLDAAQQLFKDPTFLDALEQSASQGAPSKAAVNKLSMNQRFRSYAKAFGISDDPKVWLNSTLSAAAPQMNEQQQPQSPSGAPTVEMPQ
jgi:hypothetical protein